MERFECILLLICIVTCTASTEEQYGDPEHYPTAKIALTDSGPSDNPTSGNSRYGLQVSGDQLHEYLKALKHVPESVYANGAHIIADMDESSLPESLSASRYDSDQDSESQVDMRSLIPAIRLDRHHHTPDHDRLHEEDDQPEPEARRRYVVDQDGEYEKPSLRRSFNPRDLLRDLLMRREDKPETPLTPVAAAAAQVMNDQISHVKEAMKEAKAQQAAQATEALKEKVVEVLKQKEADERKQQQAEAPKDFATASTVRVPDMDESKFKPEDERIEKYRAQESENNYKTQQNYKTQAVVMKPSVLQAVEIGPGKDLSQQEIFMGRVHGEVGKTLHYDQPVAYERENKSDTIDMKTVRDLLATLIKQIENIQSAAKSLTASSQDYAYQPKKSNKEYTKDYSKKSYSEERERGKKRKPLPYDSMEPYPSTGGPYPATKKPKRFQKSERTVYLKPDDVIKLLEPDTYESFEMPIRRNRPYSMGSSASSSSVRRMHSPYPMRRSMFPSFYPGPGYKK